MKLPDVHENFCFNVQEKISLKGEYEEAHVKIKSKLIYKIEKSANFMKNIFAILKEIALISSFI